MRVKSPRQKNRRKTAFFRKRKNNTIKTISCELKMGPDFLGIVTKPFNFTLNGA